MRVLRRMIRLESVVIAVFGAVLGLALGLVWGVCIQQVLALQGIGLGTGGAGKLDLSCQALHGFGVILGRGCVIAGWHGNCISAIRLTSTDRKQQTEGGDSGPERCVKHGLLMIHSVGSFCLGQ